MEAAQGEGLAPRGTEVLPQLEDLAPSHRVAQRLGRLGAVPPHLRLRVGAVHAQVRRHMLHRLLERHAPRMQADVEQDARRAPQQVHPLEELLLLRLVEPLFPIMSSQYNAQPSTVSGVHTTLRVSEGCCCACTRWRWWPGYPSCSAVTPSS